MTKRQQITVMSCGTIWEHPSRAIAIRYIEDRDYRTLPAPSSWINSISVRSIIIRPRWSRSHLTNRRAPRTRCSCRPSPDETFSRPRLVGSREQKWKQAGRCSRARPPFRFSGLLDRSLGRLSRLAVRGTKGGGGWGVDFRYPVSSLNRASTMTLRRRGHKRALCRRDPLSIPDKN